MACVSQAYLLSFMVRQSGQIPDSETFQKVSGLTQAMQLSQ